MKFNIEQLEQYIKEVYHNTRVLSHIEERETNFVVFSKSTPIFCDTFDYHPTGFFKKPD